MKRTFAGFGLLGSLVLALAGTAQAAGTWRQAPMPFLWSNSEVSDLAATAPDRVWMAGYQGRYCIPNPVPTLPCLVSDHGKAVVRRWNGSRWLEYPLNGVAGGYGPVNQIEASGSEVWIRSWNGNLGRFDGTAFQNVATPGGTDPGTLAVNPAGVWIRDGRYRWNGSGWTATPMPAGTPDVLGPTVVKARVPGEAWARTYRDGGYLLLRWDGSEWRTEEEFPSAGASSVVQDIEVVGPGEVWAVLSDYADHQASSRIFRYKNGAWTEQPPTGAGSISGLVLDGQGSMLAYRFGGGELGLLEYDGTAWQRQPLPAGIPLDDLTAVPGTDRLWSHSSGWPATVFTNS